MVPSPDKHENVVELDLVDKEFDSGYSALVPIGGKLPCCFQVSTSQLLDVILAFTPSYQNFDDSQKKQLRKKLNQKLYNKTRPGFYCEATQTFHFAYFGQPYGHGTQHQWRIFCTEGLKAKIETVIQGTALTASGYQSSRNKGGENHSLEWGGLYFRSEAEIRMAQALDQAQMLFFANARGRVGLQSTMVSNDQLTGRVEADFMVFYQGRCMILEVDGKHHLEEGQTIRDYARDRVLLRFGVPTVRFTAKDCLERPNEVVSEFLSILVQSQA
jgi:very-short-patch-repair endonuclease